MPQHAPKMFVYFDRGYVIQKYFFRFVNKQNKVKRPKTKDLGLSFKPRPLGLFVCNSKMLQNYCKTIIFLQRPCRKYQELGNCDKFVRNTHKQSKDSVMKMPKQIPKKGRPPGRPLKPQFDMFGERSFKSRDIDPYLKQNQSGLSNEHFLYNEGRGFIKVYTPRSIQSPELNIKNPQYQRALDVFLNNPEAYHFVNNNANTSRNEL